jgi:hypothetical protein
MGVTMSAMPALDWPEDDAASQAAAPWTVPAQLRRTETTRHQPSRAPAARAHPSRARATRHTTARAQASRDTTARAQASRGQTTRTGAVRAQAVRPPAPRGQAAPAPLRLTRRGRIVVAAAAALLVTLLSLLATGAAWATSHSVPARGAYRGVAQVVVLPGQSLWSVAENADPNADTQAVMQQIIDLNGLTSDVINIGQRLWVPRG